MCPLSILLSFQQHPSLHLGLLTSRGLARRARHRASGVCRCVVCVVWMGGWVVVRESAMYRRVLDRQIKKEKKTHDIIKRMGNGNGSARFLLFPPSFPSLVVKTATGAEIVLNACIPLHGLGYTTRSSALPPSSHFFVVFPLSYVKWLWASSHKTAAAPVAAAAVMHGRSALDDLEVHEAV
jgi:hypothetical protein